MSGKESVPRPRHATPRFQPRGNIEGKPLPEAQWHAFARLMTDQDTKILAQAEKTKAVLAELE